MSKKTEFEFLSGDGKTKIHAVKWEPESGDIKAVLQLCHGMVEYIERYEALAEYLNAKGILVAGHDHLGHGGSVTSQDEWGFFKEGSPSDTVVEDMHTMRMKVSVDFLRSWLSTVASGIENSITNTVEKLSIHAERPSVAGSAKR